MTHNRFSNFHCVYTFIQVVHTEFIKVFRVFKQAPAAVIIALISEKNKSRKEKQKRKVDIKPWFKRRKNLAFYETPIAELEEEHNYKTS